MHPGRATIVDGDDGFEMGSVASLVGKGRRVKLRRCTSYSERGEKGEQVIPGFDDRFF
jgi:hypothetical protein